MTEKAMPPSRRPATPSTLGWGVHGAGHPEQVLLGATQFSNEPEAHFGDLFPLPLPTDFGYPGRIEDLGSRRSQQRVAKRRRRLLGKERSTVEALNCMAGFNDRGSWPCFPKNAAQWSALEHVHASHQSRAPAPFQESGQAALRQLLKKKAGSGYATSTESRRTNKLFRTPPTTILGSVEAWSRLEVEEQSEVFVAQEDVKDFFSRLGISRELGEYFALPPVDIEMLKSELGDIPSELKLDLIIPL